MSSSFLCVLCNDGEVGLYVCNLLFFLRFVLFCRSLNAGRWVYPVCCSYRECVAFVWVWVRGGLVASKVTMVGVVLGGVYRFPSEAVKVVW